MNDPHEIGARSPTFFLAGTMQGAQPGTEYVDQCYRQKIKSIIQNCCPNARIHCPLEVIKQRFGNAADELRVLLSAAANEPRIVLADVDRRLREPIEVFHELLRFVAESDVLVACLPKQEPSMGTAMEMLHAHCHGRPVITITAIKQNLAVLSTSTVIVSGIEEFDSLLASGWLESWQVS